MSPLQEEMISRVVNLDEEVPINVEVPLAFAASAMGECLESIDRTHETFVNHDLQVSTLLPSLICLRLKRNTF